MKKYYIIQLALVLFLLTACGINNETGDSAITVNQDIIQIKEFAISTELPDYNTVAKGNVYIQNVQGQMKATITAAVVIGEDDWGGVSFYIPKGWNISNVLSSYPDESNKGKADDNASVWNTKDSEAQWVSFVEIGRNPERLPSPTGGGTGTVVIEVISNKDVSTPDKFSLLVSVGSEFRDGNPVVGTEQTMIEIDIDSTQ